MVLVRFVVACLKVRIDGLESLVGIACWNLLVSSTKAK